MADSLRTLGDSVSAWEHRRLRDLSHVPAVRLLLLSFVLVVVGFVLDEGLPYEGYWLTVAGLLLSLPSFAIVVFGWDRRRQPRKRRKS